MASSGCAAESATSAAAAKKLPDLSELFKAAARSLENDPANRLSGTEIRFYDAPVFAVAAADDPLFLKLKEKDVVGPVHFMPQDWVPAKTVISYFLPFSEPVCQANRGLDSAPDLWFQAHNQGAHAAANVRKFLIERFHEQNIGTFFPIHDKRYNNGGLIPTWSQRHVAYIAGLGTFSVSTNLITVKGCSGFLDSLLVESIYPATKRPYSGLRDYCANCLACIGRCPVGALAEKGNNVLACARHIFTTKPTAETSCSKCLTAVPCERRIPAGAKINAPAAPAPP
jgi:epoxyqueuosine reductase QueG